MSSAADPTRPRRATLSPADWARAALTAIGEGGLAAVAVEPLAERLGTTKGSFYWHFPNRRALIDAALQEWEETYTEALVREAGDEPDPSRRLGRLMRLVFGVTREPDRVEMALLASADDPVVAPVMQRVTERRIAWTASAYQDLGLDQQEARDRATLAVATFLGHIQLALAAPDSLPAEADWEAYLRSLSTMLLPTGASRGTTKA